MEDFQSNLPPVPNAQPIQAPSDNIESVSDPACSSGSTKVQQLSNIKSQELDDSPFSNWSPVASCSETPVEASIETQQSTPNLIEPAGKNNLLMIAGAVGAGAVGIGAMAGGGGGSGGGSKEDDYKSVVQEKPPITRTNPSNDVETKVVDDSYYVNDKPVETSDSGNANTRVSSKSSEPEITANNQSTSDTAVSDSSRTQSSSSTSSKPATTVKANTSDVKATETVTQEAPATTSNKQDTPIVVDPLIGGSSNDKLFGGDDDDYLFGGSGNSDDQLNGGKGEDRLRGGKGDDQLLGGAGDDTYLFKAGSGVDSVTDNQGSSTFIFEDVKSTDDIIVTRTSPDAIVIEYSEKDQVHIKHLDNSDKFTFSDKVTLSAQQLVDNYLYVADDFTGDIYTSGLLNTDKPTSGKIENSGDVDWLKVDLIEGQTYTFSLNGAPSELNALKDTNIVGIFDNKGKALGYGNDDANNSYNSQTVFSPAADGEYFVAVSGFESNTGSYELSISNVKDTPADDAGYDQPTQGTVSHNSDDLPYFIKALLTNEYNHLPQWDNQITYYFNDGTNNSNTDPNSFTDSQKLSIEAALESWENIANLSFELVTNRADADVGFYRDSSPDEYGGAAYAYHFGDVFVDNSTNINYKSGEYNYILVHEIGHTLGLDHPQDYGNVDASKAELPESEDLAENTVMSYDFSLRYDVYGPQFYDIAALDYIYGVKQDVNVGNDTYTLSDRYIADARGIDTLDASAETARVTINLDDGSWNHAGTISDSILDKDQSFIGYNTWIENAFGGQGSDTLTGNDLSNTLKGNDGNDYITGGTGQDTLSGGRGSDVFYFNAADDSTLALSDLITDFKSRVDKIDLSNIDANTAQSGNQAFDTLIGAKELFTQAGQLKFVDGVLYGNNDSNSNADFAIELKGVTQIELTDIIL